MAVQLYTGSPLLVGGVPAVDAACCCDTETPITCGGAANLAGCYDDLLAAYPNHPADNSAMFGYFSTIQIDLDFAGTFTGTCAADGCDLFNGGPLTLPWDSLQGAWQILTTCSAQSYTQWEWLARFFFLCEGNEYCRHYADFVFTRPTGLTWQRAISWHEDFTTQTTFTALNANMPMVSYGAIGMPTCHYGGGNATAVIH